MGVKQIASVRGMHDLLPENAPLWQEIESAIRGWIELYDYNEIRTPIVEPTPLFVRAIGEVTDIVEKEMYSFSDRLNGEALTLRPEGTASCVRAVLQHDLLYDGPKKLWYMGPMFRHERPQKGRTRQFHQFGIEAIGYPGPDVDAEHVAMCARLWKLLDLPRVRLEVNSLGQPEERLMYRMDLVRYFESRQDELDVDGRNRLQSNPLRILDSKNPAMRDVVAEAPVLSNYLSSESREHFDAFLESISNRGIPYKVNPRLVRGLDYYNKTVFEWVSNDLGAQGTICAGGRYDGLVSQLGGRAAPGCGFAMGLERIVALRQERAPSPAIASVDVFVAFSPDAGRSRALSIAEDLRDVGMRVTMNCGGGSFKAQFKRAAAQGARIAVVIGEEELRSDSVSMRRLMRAESEIDTQMRVVKHHDLVHTVRELLDKPNCTES